MVRETWQADEVSITVWIEDANGDPTGDAVYTKIFGRGFTGRQRLRKQRRPVPGRTAPMILAVHDGYDLSIAALHYQTDDDFVQFDDPTKRFRVQVAMVNPRYTGTGTLTNDTVTFSQCLASPDLTVQDGQINKIRIEFDAETRVA